jgi:hypothetical protein
VFGVAAFDGTNSRYGYPSPVSELEVSLKAINFLKFPAKPVYDRPTIRNNYCRTIEKQCNGLFSLLSAACLFLYYVVYRHPL